MARKKKTTPLWPIGVGAAIVSGVAAKELHTEFKRAKARNAHTARMKEVKAQQASIQKDIDANRVEIKKLQGEIQERIQPKAPIRPKPQYSNFEKAVRQGIAREMRAVRSEGAVFTKLPGEKTPLGFEPAAEKMQPLKEELRFWWKEFKNPVNQHTKAMALKELDDLYAAQRGMASEIGEMRGLRATQVQQITRSLSAGGKVGAQGLIAVAPVITTALDYSQFKKGVEYGKASMETPEAAFAQPSFAGKPYKRKVRKKKNPRIMRRF